MKKLNLENLESALKSLKSVKLKFYPKIGFKFKDARDFQILFLVLFLVLGIATRDWTLRIQVIGTAIGVSLFVQGLLSFFFNVGAVDNSATNLPKNMSCTGMNTTVTNRNADHRQGYRKSLIVNAYRLVSSVVRHFIAVSAPIHYKDVSLSKAEEHSAMLNCRENGYIRHFNWRSPLITALGLSLLLRVDHLATMALAASIAIASKFFLKFQGKHFFNPANIGIIAALVLTHDAWVSPGQWGEEVWYGFVFAGAGGIVLKRVGRLDTTVAFLGSYALLEAVRNLWLGWTWDVWFHRLSSGSLLLFALFMVTDPRSIPNARTGRLVWAGAIALLTFILRNSFFLSTAVFWALFILSPLTLVIDKIWPEARFVWQRSRTLSQHEPFTHPVTHGLQPIQEREA